jgi:hypothetical protein
MGGRDSLDGFLEEGPYRGSVQNYDFIGAFLQQVEAENRERNFRIMSMTGGSTVEQPKPVPLPIPAIREHYIAPNKIYTQPELERIMQPPFTPRAHAEKAYDRIRPITEQGNSSSDMVKKLECADKVLDALNLERGLLYELKQMALNARLKYGHHLPEMDSQLQRLAADIPRYMTARQNIVTSILAPRQQQLPFPKKP